MKLIKAKIHRAAWNCFVLRFPTPLFFFFFLKLLIPLTKPTRKLMQNNYISLLHSAWTNCALILKDVMHWTVFRQLYTLLLKSSPSHLIQHSVFKYERNFRCLSGTYICMRVYISQVATHTFVLATVPCNKEIPLKKCQILGLASMFLDLCIFTSI